MHGMRSTDIFDLDFTTPPPDTGKLVAEALAHAEAAILTLERALETAVVENTVEEAGWRLLASLYLGTGRLALLNALEDRHEVFFGVPMFVELRKDKVHKDPNRVAFEMPGKILHDNLPPLDEVLAACAGDKGALLDFTRVNGADEDGLGVLQKFFARLPRDDTRPELPGIERFMTGLEKAAGGEHANEKMWGMLFEYQRFCNNQEAFDDLAIRYAVRTGVSPPSW